MSRWFDSCPLLFVIGFGPIALIAAAVGSIGPRDASAVVGLILNAILRIYLAWVA